MDLDSFMNLVAQSKLAPHQDYFREIVRPAVEIRRTNTVSEPVGGSRLGGVPDLPPDTQWPFHQLESESAAIHEGPQRPYRFLGQFNFGEISPAVDLLPARGLLSLFVQYDSEGELDFFWRDEGFVLAQFTADVSNLTAHEPPDSMDSAPNQSISLLPTVDIPYDQYQRKDWPFDFDEFYDEYRALRTSLHESGEYLLGYPSHCSLAYNPTPGPDWMSLLNIDSKDDWCWHDGDSLMVFINRDHLSKHDFTSLKSDAG